MYLTIYTCLISYIKMKIIITPHGTHGDLRPLIALAVKLRERGYKIVFCGNKSDTDFINKYNFKNYAADFDLSKDLIKYKKVKSIKGQMDILKHHFECLEEVLLGNVHEAGLIIGSGYQYIGSTIAEYFNIPYLHTLHSAVFYPSSYTPPVDIPHTDLPRFINKLLWKTHDFLTRLIVLPHINNIRAMYNLKPFSTTYEIYRKHMILSTNQVLSPVPPDVSSCRFMTDYWHLSEDIGLDNELQDFLDSGDKPIYIGFGSMASRYSDKLRHAVDYLINNTDYRFIVSGSIGSLLSELDSYRVYNAGYVSHHQLFPRMKVIIHHGGAGTANTALLSGVPQIIVPHMADQYYFGDRIRRLKIGSSAVSLKRIDRELPVRIDEVLSNPFYKKNAEALVSLVQKESGVKEAVLIIEDILQ